MTKSQTPAEVIAVRLKEIRLRRGLSVAALAKICEGLGAPKLNRSVLANMEVVGRRQDVGITELMTIAQALDVPLLQLLIPFDQVGDERTLLRITPQIELSSWHALFWLSGTDDMWLAGDGAKDPERRRAWRESAVPMRLYRTWLEQFHTAGRLEDGSPEEAEALRELARTINEMVANGISPPPTPDDWVDAMKSHGWLERPAEVPVQPKWE